MMLARLTCIVLATGLSACGGSNEFTCDDEAPYLSAVRAPRVQAPEDLDNLEQLREMPIPQASPQAPRPTDSRCLDFPPLTISSD
jgi:uncharacterized lipoprotein